MACFFFIFNFLGKFSVLSYHAESLNVPDQISLMLDTVTLNNAIELLMLIMMMTDGNYSYSDSKKLKC